MTIQGLIDNYLYSYLKVNTNFDVVRREVGKKKTQGIIYYLSSLVNEVNLAILLEGLDDLSNPILANNSLPSGNIKKSYDIDVITDNVLSGVVVLLLASLDYALLIDLRLYPSRTVSEPTSEQTIRGSRDGFSESINVNVGLIRRRIRDEHLIIKSYIVSKRSKMAIAMVYLDDLANAEVIKEIDECLKRINVESLVMSDRALEELLFKQQYTPFPLVRYTERPDVASINILNGKVILLVDTSSSAIITPTTFIDHTKHVEEFRQSPMVGTFTRTLRSMAVFLSFIILPLWLALIKDDGFHNCLVLEVSSSNSHLYVVQIIIAELIFELLRIASIHTPSQLTSAVGLIAAIVLSQVSLDLGLFLPEIILMCAISSICGFATPSYELSMANKLVKLLLIILVALFGKCGFLIGLTLLYLYLSSLKTWHLPYLYPFCPLKPKKALDLFMRTNARKRHKL